ncbi:FAD/NAD(P)-binding domain-containing protein [Mycena vitilis]|nr:FAD/NAD(P)-binding domain-containing protein [Mycena vitilis]
MADSSTPLNISIVGAGIAGLAAAIALRESGHLVQIFETYEKKGEIGAALGVPPNASRVLDHFGVVREKLNADLFLGSTGFDPETGEGTVQGWATPSHQKNPAMFVHRSDLYEELKRLAIGEGEGPPAKLCLGAKVLACDPEEGTITLKNDQVVHADLVLGADGIHSTIRTHVLGAVQKPVDSGWSCFRALFEMPVGEVPDLEWYTSGVSGPRTVLAKEGNFRMLLFFPCRTGTLMNFVGYFTDADSNGAWTPTVSQEELVAQFKDFHPKFLRVLDLPTHSEILKWKLRVVPELPTWIRGRAALLGDAAHGTLPFLGQGAAMALEEAASLGCLLPAGTRREEIPARLAAYQDLRKQRGDFVRKGSVERVGVLMHTTDGSSGPNQIVMTKELQSSLLEYDAVCAAQKCFDERFGAELTSN